MNNIAQQQVGNAIHMHKPTREEEQSFVLLIRCWCQCDDDDHGSSCRRSKQCIIDAAKSDVVEKRSRHQRHSRDDGQLGALEAAHRQKQQQHRPTCNRQKHHQRLGRSSTSCGCDSLVCWIHRHHRHHKSSIATELLVLPFNTNAFTAAAIAAIATASENNLHRALEKRQARLRQQRQQQRRPATRRGCSDKGKQCVVHRQQRQRQGRRRGRATGSALQRLLVSTLLVCCCCCYISAWNNPSSLVFCAAAGATAFNSPLRLRSVLEDDDIDNSTTTESPFPTQPPTAISDAVSSQPSVDTALPDSGARRSIVPTLSPATDNPIANATVAPTMTDSDSPTTMAPTISMAPSVSAMPSLRPSLQPSIEPTVSQIPSLSPSLSQLPTLSGQPSFPPTDIPSQSPTFNPTHSPTESPTSQPTVQPSASPSSHPSAHPSAHPSQSPTLTQIRITKTKVFLTLDGLYQPFSNAEQVAFFEQLATRHMLDYYRQLERELPQLASVTVHRVDTILRAQELLPKQQKPDDVATARTISSKSAAGSTSASVRGSAGSNHDDNRRRTSSSNKNQRHLKARRSDHRIIDRDDTDHHDSNTNTALDRSASTKPRQSRTRGQRSSATADNRYLQDVVGTDAPGATPTNAPKSLPPTITTTPTQIPTSVPSVSPTTSSPSSIPTASPVTSMPTSNPTDTPTSTPTKSPVTFQPTSSPTATPTEIPTITIDTSNFLRLEYEQSITYSILPDVDGVPNMDWTPDELFLFPILYDEQDLMIALTKIFGDGHFIRLVEYKIDDQVSPLAPTPDYTNPPNMLQPSITMAPTISPTENLINNNIPQSESIGPSQAVVAIISSSIVISTLFIVAGFLFYKLRRDEKIRRDPFDISNHGETQEYDNRSGDDHHYDPSSHMNSNPTNSDDHNREQNIWKNTIFSSSTQPIHNGQHHRRHHTESSLHSSSYPPRHPNNITRAMSVVQSDITGLSDKLSFDDSSITGGGESITQQPYSFKKELSSSPFRMKSTASSKSPRPPSTTASRPPIGLPPPIPTMASTSSPPPPQTTTTSPVHIPNDFDNEIISFRRTGSNQSSSNIIQQPTSNVLQQPTNIIQPPLMNNTDDTLQYEYETDDDDDFLPHDTATDAPSMSGFNLKIEHLE